MVLNNLGNGLTGTIPKLESYGNLSDVDLSFNSMSGSIPPALQSLQSLTYFNIKSNKFVGLITEFGELPFSYTESIPGLLNLK